MDKYLYLFEKNILEKQFQFFNTLFDIELEMKKENAAITSLKNLQESFSSVKQLAQDEKTDFEELYKNLVEIRNGIKGLMTRPSLEVFMNEDISIELTPQGEKILQQFPSILHQHEDGRMIGTIEDIGRIFGHYFDNVDDLPITEDVIFYVNQAEIKTIPIYDQLVCTLSKNTLKKLLIYNVRSKIVKNLFKNDGKFTLTMIELFELYSRLPKGVLEIESMKTYSLRNQLDEKYKKMVDSIIHYTPPV